MPSIGTLGQLFKIPPFFGGVWEGSPSLLLLVWRGVRRGSQPHQQSDAHLKVGLQRGRAGSDQELAIVARQLRRRIGSATIRANYTLLLERMAQVGAGAGRAKSG
jgi:hypothetical protein